MQEEGTRALLCVTTITAPTGRPCCFAKATKSPPCPKHRAARRGFSKRHRTTEKQQPKIKHVPVAGVA